MTLIIILNVQTIALNAKDEWKLEVKGAAPITVAWYKDGKKMKSSRSIKITWVRGIAKLCFLEAQEDEAGEYRVEAVNNYGENSLTANLEVTGRNLDIIIKYHLFVDHIS